MQPSVNQLLVFLTRLYDAGLRYSALNTARSAISSFLELSDFDTLGNHSLVKRFMKGVFSRRPALPRNKITWDVSVVLDFLRRLSPVKTLSLLQLSKKLATLIALLSGQRRQTLQLLDLRNMRLKKFCVTFTLGDLLKQSKPGHHLGQITLAGYPPDRRLCVVTVLKEYFERTKILRGETTSLFITTQEPYNVASVDTLSRWIKDTLSAAGIDMGVFTPHSTRAASVTAASQSRIPLDTILKTAGWSNSRTFANYYHKPIVDDQKYSESILDRVKARDTVTNSTISTHNSTEGSE